MPEGDEIPGLEVSGTVETLGPGVSSLKVGDRVAAYLPMFGGYAEVAVAPEQFVYPVGDIELKMAAGFPCAGPTAYGLLHGPGRLRAGETVLVHAAAGGVGSYTALLARAAGAALVIGTVGSADKIPYAAALGYHYVVVRDDFEAAVRDLTDGRGVDLALDPVGGPVRAGTVDLMRPFGRMVAFGDAGGYDDDVFPGRDLWKRNLMVGGYNIADLARRDAAALAAHAAAALDALTRDQARLPVTTTYPLDAVRSAHSLMESGQTIGKAVLAINP